MKKTFLTVILIATTFIYSDCYAKNDISCGLDAFFLESGGNRLIKANESKSKLDKVYNNLSLYPSISIGSGQYSSNRNGFKGVGSSSFSLSISQAIYSGGVYNIKNKQILQNEMLGKLKYELQRNDWLLNLYGDVLNYRTINKQLSQVRKSLKNIEVKHKLLMSQFSEGARSKLDVELSSLNVDELKIEIISLGENLKLQEKKVYDLYRITPDKYWMVTSANLLNCNFKKYRDIINGQRVVESKINELGADIDNAALLPSIYASISISPPKNGNIEDITLINARYAASIYVSIPISNLFLSSINELKKEANNDSLLVKMTEANNGIMNRKIDFLSKINKLNEEIRLLNKKMAVQKKMVKYAEYKFHQKNEGVYSFYEAVNLYDRYALEAENKESLLEYYKVGAMFFG